jgi:serine/threonine protein kinase
VTSGFSKTRPDDVVARASSDVVRPLPSATPVNATARRTSILAGKYRIEREIDGGAMGRVFSAVQLGLDRPVAIKVMREVSDEFRRRFLLEARSLASLNHRNIVSIIDSGETSDGVVFIVMEYLRGETLADALKREVRVDVPRTVQLAIQIARGLRAAHRQGIVHRDLKPSNIFLIDDDEGGELVKLLDFGVAKALDDASRLQPRVTREGIIVGTPTYMAPEGVKNDCDGRADLYSLGCVLYQMIAGRPPFVQVNGPLDVLAAHLHDEPTPLSTRAPWVPRGVEALVMRLLKKKPDERFASAEALLDALKTQLALIFNDPFRPFTTDPSMDAIPLIRTATPPSAFAAPPLPLPVASDVTAIDLTGEFGAPAPAMSPSLSSSMSIDATLELPELDESWRARFWNRARAVWARARSTLRAR